MAKSPMAPARMVGRAAEPLRLGGMTMAGLVTSRMWHPASSKTAAVSAGHTLSRWERGLARGCVLCVVEVMALALPAPKAPLMQALEDRRGGWGRYARVGNVARLAA